MEISLLASKKFINFGLPSGFPKQNPPTKTGPGKGPRRALPRLPPPSTEEGGGPAAGGGGRGGVGGEGAPGAGGGGPAPREAAPWPWTICFWRKLEGRKMEEDGVKVFRAFFLDQK